MKNILMIGTGGTIASKQTEYGLAPGLSAEDILNYIPAVRRAIWPTAEYWRISVFSAVRTKKALRRLNMILRVRRVL